MNLHRNLRLALVLAFLLILPISPLLAAPPDLPDLKLKVGEITGEVQYTDTEGQWKQAEPGQVIPEGSKVKVGEAGQAALKVPGLSYLEVEKNTELKVGNLSRDTEIQGALLTEEEVIINEIELETEKGSVSNSLRDLRQVENNYEVKTPNAVAGVRGTSFNCRVEPGERTEVAVLEGRVRFSNRGQPGAFREVGGRQRSSLGVNENRPSAPEPIGEERAKRLKAVKKNAERELLLPPKISALEVAGKAADQQVRLKYTMAKEIQLSGRATPREEGAELSAVRVRVGDQQLDVEGLAEWQASFTPESPAQGETREIPVTVSAVDSEGTRSELREFTLVLIHPEERGEVRFGYVQLQVTKLGGKNIADLSFPLQLSEAALDENQVLSMSGSASSDAGEIAAVAVQLAGQEDFRSKLFDIPPEVQEKLVSGETSLRQLAAEDEAVQLADGTAEWSVAGPVETGREFSLEIIAWTENNVVSEPQVVGPITVGEPVTNMTPRVGDVQVELTELGGRSAEEISFPLKLPTSALQDGKLVARGTARSSAGEIAGVAAIPGELGDLQAKIDQIPPEKKRQLEAGEITFKQLIMEEGEAFLAEGTDNWEISGPAEPGVDIEANIVAWTENNVIGEPLNFGPIRITYPEIPPQNYEQGDVRVEVTQLAGAPVGEMEFPVHAYKGDLREGGLYVEGVARAAAEIEAVAYSLDGGRSWDLARGTENWSFLAPISGTGEYNLQVVAWSADGLVGEPVELGPIQFENISYSNALRRNFAAQWDAFEREDVSGFGEYLAEEFVFLPPDEAQEYDKYEFLRFLDNEFSRWQDLRVDYQINEIFGNPSGGDLKAEVVWRGKQESRETGDYHPFQSKGQGTLKYVREQNGQFRMVSFEDYLPTFYTGVESLKLYDPSGYVPNGLWPGWIEVRDNSNILDQTPPLPEVPEGGLIFGVRETAQTFGGDTIWVNSGTFLDSGLVPPVAAGGVWRTGKTSLSDIGQIPSIDNNRYQSSVALREGEVYVALLETEWGNVSSAIFKVVNIWTDHVEIKLISSDPPPEQAPILDYEGVNPFEY